MKLRRFEFGISKTTADEIEVYARRSDGRLYLRSYSREIPDLLEVAQVDFLKGHSQWQMREALPDSPGLSLVWETGARLHISGESAITSAELAAASVDLLVSMSQITAITRSQIQAYGERQPRFRHLDVPMLDVLPEHQGSEGRANAILALDEADRALRQGATVAIHCLMGIHRSVSVGTVALARAGLVSTPREGFLAIQGRRHLASWVPETVEWLAALPRSGR